MRNRLLSVYLSGLLLFFFSGTALAQHGHDHGTPSKAVPKKAAPQEAREKSSAQTLNVEGLKITFEVMKMDEHMQHIQAAKGGSHGDADHAKSHSIMVTIQDKASREIISDAKVMFLVSSASGAEESGKLEWSGDHYAGGFSPKAKGTYQVQLKIASGGMEREAKFLYEGKK
jgi:hypothetical protein